MDLERGQGASAGQRWSWWDSNAKILLLLICIALVRGLLYALVNPPFSSPDEKGHYDYLASMLAVSGSSPEGQESHQPPLYYWLSLPFFAAFAGHGSDLQIYGLAAGEVSLQSLYAVRLFSTLMIAATVPIAYWSARSVCPNDRFVCLGTAAFVALVPAYGWLGASINNDNLAILLSSAMILLLLQSMSQGFSPGRLAALAILIAAGIATKQTTWPIAAMVGAVLVTGVVSRWFTLRQLLAASIGVILILGALLASPARGILLAPIGAIVKRWGNPSTLSGEGLSTFFANVDGVPFVYQFKTFWGSFATDSIQLPAPVYWVLALLVAAALIGLAMRVADALSSRPLLGETPGQVMTLAISVAMVWTFSFIRFYTNEPLRPDQRIAGWDEDLALMQGRFLFPVIIPMAFLLMWGLGAMLPPRMKKHGVLVFTVLLIAVDWIALAVLAYGGNAWHVYSTVE